MQRLLITLLLLASLASCANPEPRDSKSPPGIAVKDTVTLVELGSLHCKPCQLMMPILDSLRIKYAGRVAVKFIDVEKYPEQGRLLKIMTIPTQIIYNRQGLEVVHHVGFFPQEQIEEELEKILEGPKARASNRKEKDPQ